VVPFDPAHETEADLLKRLAATIDAYRTEYRAYYERCRRPNSPKIRASNPVVYLIPAIGMITFAADKTTARIAAEFYTNAINVMRESASVSTYRGLPEQEAFDIEYWPLEEAKLQRMPKPKALAGSVALITGGAGGIGVAIAKRLLDEGACAVLCDIDREALARSEATLRKHYSADVVASVWVDVTREDAVDQAFVVASWLYGGIDICVSNAGIASASPVEETSLALEGAPFGIRVNVVNPDAVIRGSRIWQGEWAEQRARQYKTTPDELEAVYRERSLLKRSVYPEDIAEAVAFFASERSAKSTGNILNVDAGNAAAFTR
jgi:NAD(P)-dependent dehydrogenase (short-subunit alcohol dehydrogenase family)